MFWLWMSLYPKFKEKNWWVSVSFYRQKWYDCDIIHSEKPTDYHLKKKRQVCYDFEPHFMYSPKSTGV